MDVSGGLPPGTSSERRVANPVDPDSRSSFLLPFTGALNRRLAGVAKKHFDAVGHRRGSSSQSQLLLAGVLCRLAVMVDACCLIL
jgi:hypothetical protein